MAFHFAPLLHPLAQKGFGHRDAPQPRRTNVVHPEAPSILTSTFPDRANTLFSKDMEQTLGTQEVPNGCQFEAKFLPIYLNG